MRRASLLLLLFSIANGNSCPSGYTQAPNQGPCYMALTFYNDFIGQFTPTSFENAENYCERSGAFLASVHSKEENDYIYSSVRNTTHSCSPKNIGLKCQGRNCRWRDGSPVTYTNFYPGASPTDDGRTFCYGLDPNTRQWIPKECNKDQGDSSGHYGDCWICKTPIVCLDGETPYNGGCIAVHTAPLDQKSAEEACKASPGGGHLVSIHNFDENADATKFARSAGANSTVLIGGEFSNGVFEWTDGSIYDDPTEWAKGFPNIALGDCVQILLDNTFGPTQLWTNVDCNAKQPFICFRGRDFNATTEPPPAPKSDAQCPPIQYYTGSGSVYSPNFPVAIPSQQTCEYHLESKEGTRAKVQFGIFNCQSGSSLSIFDGLDSELPFITFTTNYPPLNQTYTATTNSMKIIFSTIGNASPEGTGWEAEFTAK